MTYTLFTLFLLLTEHFPLNSFQLHIFSYPVFFPKYPIFMCFPSLGKLSFAFPLVSSLNPRKFTGGESQSSRDSPKFLLIKCLKMEIWTWFFQCQTLCPQVFVYMSPLDLAWNTVRLSRGRRRVSLQQLLGKIELLYLWKTCFSPFIIRKERIPSDGLGFPSSWRPLLDATQTDSHISHMCSNCPHVRA